MFTLKFDTDNEAFVGENGPDEVAKILRQVARAVLDTNDSGIVRDSNGNRIGTWALDLPIDNESEDDE